MTKITALISFVIISIIFIIEMPQTIIAANTDKNANNRDEELLKSQVLQFLTTWLVDRDAVKAIDSFSLNAFSNEAIFDEECSGIRDEDRNSKDDLKKTIEKFLKVDDWLPVFDSLNGALEIDVLLPLNKKLKNRVVNTLIQDRFLLVQIKPSDVVNLTSQKKSRDFMKKYLKQSGPLYLSIISPSNGIVFLVWEKDGANWKIFHVSLVCM